LCPTFQFNQTGPEDVSGNDQFCEFTTRMLGSVERSLVNDRPDLIVYDFMAFAGRILTRRWGVPAIQTSPFYAFGEQDFEGQVDHAAFRSLLLKHANTISQFLARHNVVSRNYRTEKEELNIYLFPRILQPNDAQFGADCFFAGRCAAERLIPGRWIDHSEGRPIALLAMSTIFATVNSNSDVPEHFKLCIDVLSRNGWHVVVAPGERCDRSILEPLPAHCELIHYTTYLKVLPRADVLFFMSGIISTAEAVYHGVPMIAITNGVAEFEWQAQRIVELGLGLHVSKSEMSSAAMYTAAVRLLRSPDVLARVREVRYRVRREPGAEDAANRIEDYLHTRLPDRV
jgi:MGT family glycosyltransferase